MAERFTSDWQRVRPAIRALRQVLADAEHLLVESFSAVCAPSLRVQSIRDMESGLEFVVGTGQIPWVLYDAIAEVLEHVQEPTKVRIAQSVRIATGYRCENLRITRDGRWQVAWIVNPDADDFEDREIALDWYAPPNANEAPIVPIPIIDYIAGCVMFLQADLVLPAAASLLIVLESALWEALSKVGITRKREQVKYMPATWHVNRAGHKLAVTIEGAARDLVDLDAVVGGSPHVDLEVRRTKGGLVITLDELLLPFFASSLEEERKEITHDGLSVAIDRARKARREGREELVCMDVLPEFLDKTVISLRNNLIHLPHTGNLPQPIPVPAVGELTTIDDLRSNSRLLRTLLPWVVGFINAVYADSVEPEIISAS